MVRRNQSDKRCLSQVHASIRKRERDLFGCPQNIHQHLQGKNFVSPPQSRGLSFCPATSHLSQQLCGLKCYGQTLKQVGEPVPLETSIQKASPFFFPMESFIWISSLRPDPQTALPAQGSIVIDWYCHHSVWDRSPQVCWWSAIVPIAKSSTVRKSILPTWNY